MIKNDLRSAQLIMLDILKIFAAICKKHNLTYWLEGGTLLGAVRHKGFIPWDDDVDVSMPSADYHKFLAVAPQELPNDIFLQNRQTDPSLISAGVTKLRNTHSLALGYDDDYRAPYHKGVNLDVFEYVQYPNISRAGVWFFSKMLMTTYIVLHTKQRLTLKTAIQYFAFSIEYRIFKPLWTLLCRYFKGKKYISHIIETNVYKIVHRNDHIFPVKPILFEGEYFDAPCNCDAYLTAHFGDYMQLPPPEKQVQHNYMNFTHLP
jgi:lipopolysaccharide cholinephosphotransferase